MPRARGSLVFHVPVAARGPEGHRGALRARRRSLARRRAPLASGLDGVRRSCADHLGHGAAGASELRPRGVPRDPRRQALRRAALAARPPDRGRGAHGQVLRAPRKRCLGGLLEQRLHGGVQGDKCIGERTERRAISGARRRRLQWPPDSGRGAVSLGGVRRGELDSLTGVAQREGVALQRIGTYRCFPTMSGWRRSASFLPSRPSLQTGDSCRCMAHI
mmetsp:Transcript_67868/g.175973  ORF Transcript_67868/g.175973 Transcript_67868/m.175973 type:complete len:219 (+) Transcript_67868:1122-1778(+)